MEEPMANALAGHTNTYHTYGFDEALEGIASAGYEHVELSAVPGWTEHVDLDTPPADVRRKLEDYGLEAVSLSGHQSADENEAAFLANIGELADAAESAGVVVALEIHGDIMASSDVTIPLLEKIGRDSVKVNYDTANV